LRLVALACFKLISPYLPSEQSPASRVDQIPSETLRACSIFIKIADLNCTVAQARPALLTVVRLVLAVRSGDSGAALACASHLLLPSREQRGAPVDPLRCYKFLHRVLSASNMTSELCDVSCALLHASKSAGPQADPVPFEHAFDACLDCCRFLGPGGAVRLLLDFPNAYSKAQEAHFYDKIIQRAVIARRLDVLRDGHVAQVMDALRWLTSLICRCAHDAR
jgi:hypothetical protein